MKKSIIPVILILIMAFNVSAWGAQRTISGNQVTIAVDSTSGTGVFTVQETVVGATITNFPSSACGLANNVLTCDYNTGDSDIVYQTTGSGTVSGTITGGYPSTSQSITGDSAVPVASAVTCAKTEDCLEPACAGEVTTDGFTCCQTDDNCPANKICGPNVCVFPNPEDCTNGVDDNFNNLVDCADPDCANNPACTSPIECSDRDRDGFYAEGCPSITRAFDCDDRNAQIHPGATEICGNKIDENCDGKDTPCDSLTILIQAVTAAINSYQAGTTSKLATISVIASALKTYFG